MTEEWGILRLKPGVSLHLVMVGFLREGEIVHRAPSFAKVWGWTITGVQVMAVVGVFAYFFACGYLRVFSSACVCVRFCMYLGVV